MSDEEFVFEEGENQRAARLFDCDRNGLTGKTPAQVEEEVLQGFRRVFECAELFLLGGGRDQTQIVFGIDPINFEKSANLR